MKTRLKSFHIYKVEPPKMPPLTAASSSAIVAPIAPKKTILKQKKNADPKPSDTHPPTDAKIFSPPLIKEMPAIPPTMQVEEHIVLNELYDADVMDALLRDVKTFSKKDLGNLTRYKRGRKHGNQVEVVYHYAKGFESNKLGRLYARDGQGLQAFPFDMRNPLLAKHYWDIDMENCHYNILAVLAEGWNLKTDNIRYYINNRNECLTKVSSNRGVAKTAYLKIAYGGNIKIHHEFYNDDGVPAEADLSVVRAIEKEMSFIVDTCWAKHFETLEKSQQKIILKKPNPKFSLFALILQTEERKCLMAMMEYFRLHKRSVDILIHDGAEIRKLEGEIEFPTDLIEGVEKHITLRTGYTFKVVNKPFCHNFKMPDTKDAEIIDDEYAARFFVKLLGDKIARDKEDIYYFNDSTGLWANNETAFREAVSANKDKLIFTTYNEKGDPFTINYGGKEVNVKAMSKWILPALPDTQFITRNGNSSKHKLLFADGIYDFNTGFTEGFDPTIVFNKRIDRKYPKHRDDDLIKKINNILFVNAFSTDGGEAVGDYMKKALSVSLAGDYRRKKFYMGLGEANCGKGLLVSAFREAFEGYIAEWDGNNLKYNPRNGQDEAKKLAWIRNLIGSRIAFSSELRMDKTPIDGNLLKKVSSGGDAMGIRGNCQDEFEFVNRATMFLLANDLCEITPKDTGTQSRIRVMRYRLKFVPKSEEDLKTASGNWISDERPMDAEIKEKFETTEYKNALFHLMADTFSNMQQDERKWGGQLNDPSAVLEDTREWSGDSLSDFKTLIEGKYEITNSVADMVRSDEICKYIIDECKQKLSENKVGRELSKLLSLPDGSPKDININGKKHRYGLRHRAEE